MYSAAQIEILLGELEERQADDLEDQWLDFKQWNERSMSDSVDMVVEIAVCMANGGGGTVVFGIKDWVTGRENAILGVPHEVDINRLRGPPADTPVSATSRGAGYGDGRGSLSASGLRSARDPQRDGAQPRLYLERGGTGRGTYWILRHDLHRRLLSSGQPDRERRIDWEAAKTRVLSVRAEHGETGLSNADIRRITHLDRNQVLRLMRELKSENAEISGLAVAGTRGMRSSEHQTREFALECRIEAV